MSSRATASARANIALVKYWGKRDRRLNLPAVGSLSMTLSALTTTTSVSFEEGLPDDEFTLNDTPVVIDNGCRMRRVLDEVRSQAGFAKRARVLSCNDFATAAGLASSASGFAALALAAARAAGLDTKLTTLAHLARLGSGSAPRSLLGGIVALEAGESADGSDCLPVQLTPEGSWEIELLVVITGSGSKEVGSAEGMELSRTTSPYYSAWLREAARDLARGRRAVAARDFGALGRVTEASCFRMHAVALAATPALLYWNGVTVEVIRKVQALRRLGLEAYSTVDAGPHVKVLVCSRDSARLAQELGAVDGVLEVLTARPGPGAWEESE